MGTSFLYVNEDEYVLFQFRLAFTGTDFLFVSGSPQIKIKSACTLVQVV